jgi:type IV pilus assembly protein PilE
MRKKIIKIAGFSVIEMCIVLVVIGICALVAVSLYRPYVLKSHRADGISAILSLQLAEERYRSSNTTYGTLAQIGGSSASSEGYYTLSVSSASATGYTITATGQGNQANDTENGTSCASLTLTASNGTISQTPTACWPS